MGTTRGKPFPTGNTQPQPYTERGCAHKGKEKAGEKQKNLKTPTRDTQRTQSRDNRKFFAALGALHRWDGVGRNQEIIERMVTPGSFSVLVNVTV
ncbi:MAG: hypothetical protein QXK85_01235, partial [Thermofilum sp.]